MLRVLFVVMQLQVIIIGPCSSSQHLGAFERLSAHCFGFMASEFGSLSLFSYNFWLQQAAFFQQKSSKNPL